MLIYDPALDPYHCAIRVLTVLENGPIPDLPIDSVRIADFYLAYPSKVAEIRLPNSMVKIRKYARELATPYRNPFGLKSAFDRMHPIFQATISTLAAANHIDTDLMKRGFLQRTETPLPADLQKVIREYLTRQSKIRNFIARDLTAIPLLGSGGLKDRSGLLEYRYDPT